VEIVTVLTRANHRAATFEYEMRLAPAGDDGEKMRRIATGHTSHMFLNR